jgi:Flp pilus assembly protein TadD
VSGRSTRSSGHYRLAESDGSSSQTGTRFLEAAARGLPPGTRRAIPIFIVVVIVAVFFPVCGHEFVDFGDQRNIVENEEFRPTTPLSLARCWDWHRPAGELYGPVTYSAWGILAAGAYDPLTELISPVPFHVANLALHAAAALCAYGVLRSLRAAHYAAAAGALLWAVHPLQVEPVAWASGMRELLSGALCLAGLWAYVHFARLTSPDDRARNRGFYAVATLAFVLAMLAKPSAVALPLVAGAIAVLVLGRSARRTALELAPWVLAAIPIVLIVMRGQTRPSGAAGGGGEVMPAWFRPIVAIDALAMDVVKTCVPARLGIDYGRSPQYLARTVQPSFTWMIQVALGVGAWGLRRHRPRWAIGGVAVFALAVLPALGLVPFDGQGTSTIADRCLYVALLGPAIIAALVLTARPGRMATAIAGVVLIALGVRAHLQTRYWRSSQTLFAHALEVNPRSAVAAAAVGAEEMRLGNLDRASELLAMALETNPQNDNARLHLGLVLAHQGRAADAIRQYEWVLRRLPEDADAHFELANVLLHNGRAADAIAHYQAALRTSPGAAAIHANLAMALLAVEPTRGDEAVLHLKLATQFDSTNARLHAQLGELLASRDDAAGALQQYDAAFRLEPSLAYGRRRRELLGEMLKRRER